LKIYTSVPGGEKTEKVREYKLGIMIPTSPNWLPSRSLGEFDCALDNGAFRCFERGFPFMERRFLDTLDACYTSGISLDFIVAPDIVGGGVESLDFSMEWANGRLRGCKSLALAVQDGMMQSDISTDVLDLFSHIFIGGTPGWKWRTAGGWCKFAHDNHKLCHIGQCGTLPNLTLAREHGVDSVDSSSFVRNDSWHILDVFLGRKTLFDVGEPQKEGK